MNQSVLWPEPNRLHLPLRPLCRGLALALVSCTLGLATAGGLKLLLPAELWGSAASNRLEGASDLFIFYAAILFAPLFETFVSQLVPIEILRRYRAGPTMCIMVSAALFGLGHFYSGGLASGLTTGVGGTVLAYAYMSARKDGVGAAYVCSVVAHAGSNALLVYLVQPLFST